MRRVEAVSIEGELTSREACESQQFKLLISSNAHETRPALKIEEWSPISSRDGSRIASAFRSGYCYRELLRAHRFETHTTAVLHSLNHGPAPRINVRNTGSSWRLLSPTNTGALNRLNGPFWRWRFDLRKTPK